MNSNWKRVYRGSSLLSMVLLCLCLLQLAPSEAQAVQRRLTLADVQLQACAYNAELKDLQTKEELLEVNLAKVQADLKALSKAGKVKRLQVILKEVEKEQTKKQHSKIKKNIELPPEVDLRFQIAALQDHIAKAERDVYDKQLSIVAGVEQAYYDVLLANRKLDFWKGCETEALQQLRLIRRQYQVGAASQGDVALVEEQYTKAQTENAKAILKAEALKRILGDWIGADVNIGYTFADALSTRKLTRDDLEPAIGFAKGRDVNVYQAEQALKQAETEYTAVLGTNPNLYLQYEQEIKNYILLSKGKKLSYTVFLRNYHKPQLEAAHMWEGNYLFSWMFFQASGPREWIQPAGVSKEVGADQKTAIFSLYLVRKQATENAKSALEASNAKVNSAYEAVADLEKKRQEINATLQQIENEIAMLGNRQKLTGAEFAGLYQRQVQAAELQNELQDSHILYAKVASAFNLVSGGYLSQPVAMTTDTAVVEEPKPDAAWKMSTTATERRFILQVQLTPVVYDVNQFQLFYDGQPIGEKTPVRQTLSAATIPYRTGKETLSLQFYKGDVLRYTAEIPGDCYEGVLMMCPNSASLSPYEVAKQKKQALEVQVKELQQKYLKAVEAGNSFLAKYLEIQRDAAVAALLKAEEKMKTLKEKAATGA